MIWKHFQLVSPFQYPSILLSPSIWHLHQPRAPAVSLLYPFSSRTFPFPLWVSTFQPPFHNIFVKVRLLCLSLSRLLPFLLRVLPLLGQELASPRCSVSAWERLLSLLIDTWLELKPRLPCRKQPMMNALQLWHRSQVYSSSCSWPW